jgi:hypothetical protein
VLPDPADEQNQRLDAINEEVDTLLHENLPKGDAVHSFFSVVEIGRRGA